MYNVRFADKVVVLSKLSSKRVCQFVSERLTNLAATDKVVIAVLFLGVFVCTSDSWHVQDRLLVIKVDTL